MLPPRIHFNHVFVVAMSVATIAMMSPFHKIHSSCGVLGFMKPCIITSQDPSNSVTIIIYKNP